jgi:hypothetical protein
VLPIEAQERLSRHYKKIHSNNKSVVGDFKIVYGAQKNLKKNCDIV